MSFGFSAVNAGGTIVIDSDYVGMQLVASGSVATVVPPSSLSTYNCTQVVIGISPGDLVFIHCASSPTARISGIISGASVTVIILGSTTPQTIYYKIGRRSSLIYASPPGGFGLNVMTATGALAFSSALESMEVHSAFNIYYPNVANGGSQTVALPATPSGKLRYTCINSCGFTYTERYTNGKLRLFMLSIRSYNTSTVISDALYFNLPAVSSPIPTTLISALYIPSIKYLLFYDR